MPEHRIRLTDSDLDILVAALTARRAMYVGPRRAELERLLARLSDLAPGNPGWRIGPEAAKKPDQTSYVNMA